MACCGHHGIRGLVGMLNEWWYFQSLFLPTFSDWLRPSTYGLLMDTTYRTESSVREVFKMIGKKELLSKLFVCSFHLILEREYLWEPIQTSVLSPLIYLSPLSLQCHPERTDKNLGLTLNIRTRKWHIRNRKVMLRSCNTPLTTISSHLFLLEEPSTP